MQAHAAAESAAKKNAADLDAVTKDLVNNEFHAKFELDQRHEQTDQLRKASPRCGCL